jgi:hypothetical protein
MTTEDRARLRNIADRLQAIAHELRQFEKTTNDPGLKQAGTSAAMALAWIGLVDNLQANDGTEISDTSPDERQRMAMNINVNEKRNSQWFAGGVFAIS